MLNIIKPIITLSLFCALPSFAGSFTLASNDISHGEFMNKKHEFSGFGCTGEDVSPHLKWANAPKGTKSFAITAYDPDAPTGSGWWHWQVINIPVSVMELPANSGNKTASLLPATSQQIQNDYGIAGFGGACPPKGHGVHHYQFTVHALAVEKLTLPDNASGALTGYMINANTLATSSIEALYKKD